MNTTLKQYVLDNAVNHFIKGFKEIKPSPIHRQDLIKKLNGNNYKFLLDTISILTWGDKQDGTQEAIEQTVTIISPLIVIPHQLLLSKPTSLKLLEFSELLQRNKITLIRMDGWVYKHLIT